MNAIETATSGSVQSLVGRPFTDYPVTVAEIGAAFMCGVTAMSAPEWARLQERRAERETGTRARRGGLDCISHCGVALEYFGFCQSCGRGLSKTPLREPNDLAMPALGHDQSKTENTKPI